MAAITTLRTTIATALVDNTKYSIFSFPPATPIANSVTINPADPYISPTNNQEISIAPMANFRLALFVPLMDNQGNLAGLEDMIVAVMTKIAASSLKFRIGSVSIPSVYESQTGDLLTCDIALSIFTEWS
jgi:hypothetical protein